MVKRTLEQRYWAKVDVRGPDECWPWMGGDNGKGYGKFYDGTVMRLAHRVGWKIAHGEDPGEWDVLHSCDTPLCQNPSHWRLGTHLDNMHEMAERGRAKYVHGEECGKSKLTEQKVKEIRALYKSGATLKAIAADFGIHFTTVSQIVRRKTWRHLE